MDSQANVRESFPDAVVKDAVVFGRKIVRVYGSSDPSSIVLGEGNTLEEAWRSAWLWLVKHREATSIPSRRSGGWGSDGMDDREP